MYHQIKHIYYLHDIYVSVLGAQIRWSLRIRYTLYLFVAVRITNHHAIIGTRSVTSEQQHLVDGQPTVGVAQLVLRWSMKSARQEYEPKSQPGPGRSFLRIHSLHSSLLYRRKFRFACEQILQCGLSVVAYLVRGCCTAT